MKIEKVPQHFVIRHVGGQALIIADHTGYFEIHYDNDEKEEFDRWKEAVEDEYAETRDGVVKVKVIDCYFDEGYDCFVIKCQLINHDGEKYYL